MSVVGFVRKALAMGVDLETALKMGEAFEAESPAAPILSDAMARKRQYDRARMAEKRAEAQRRRNDSDDVARLAATPTTTDDVAASPTYTRGENNLSRLEDTCSAAVAEAREPISDWPAGGASRHAALLAQLAGTSRLDPSRQPGLATTLGRLAAWKRDGASWTYDVVPAVTIMSQKRGPPIATWKYFDPAIAQSIADNRRALQIPSAANGPRHERPDPRSAKLDAKQANMERALRGAQMAIARRAI